MMKVFYLEEGKRENSSKKRKEIVEQLFTSSKLTKMHTGHVASDGIVSNYLGGLANNDGDLKKRTRTFLGAYKAELNALVKDLNSGQNASSDAIKKKIENAFVTSAKKLKLKNNNKKVTTDKLFHEYLEQNGSNLNDNFKDLLNEEVLRITEKLDLTSVEAARDFSGETSIDSDNLGGDNTGYAVVGHIGDLDGFSGVGEDAEPKLGDAAETIYGNADVSEEVAAMYDKLESRDGNASLPGSTNYDHLNRLKVTPDEIKVNTIFVNEVLIDALGVYLNDPSPEGDAANKKRPKNNVVQKINKLVRELANPEEIVEDPYELNADDIINSGFVCTDIQLNDFLEIYSTYLVKACNENVTSKRDIKAMGLEITRSDDVYEGLAPDMDIPESAVDFVDIKTALVRALIDKERFVSLDDVTNIVVTPDFADKVLMPAFKEYLDQAHSLNEERVPGEAVKTKITQLLGEFFNGSIYEAIDELEVDNAWTVGFEERYLNDFLLKFKTHLVSEYYRNTKQSSSSHEGLKWGEDAIEGTGFVDIRGALSGALSKKKEYVQEKEYVQGLKWLDDGANKIMNKKELEDHFNAAFGPAVEDYFKPFDIDKFSEAVQKEVLYGVEGEDKDGALTYKAVQRALVYRKAELKDLANVLNNDLMRLFVDSQSQSHIQEYNMFDYAAIRKLVVDICLYDVDKDPDNNDIKKLRRDRGSPLEEIKNILAKSDPNPNVGVLRASLEKLRNPQKNRPKTAVDAVVRAAKSANPAGPATEYNRRQNWPKTKGPPPKSAMRGDLGANPKRGKKGPTPEERERLSREAYKKFGRI